MQHPEEGGGGAPASVPSTANPISQLNEEEQAEESQASYSTPALLEVYDAGSPWCRYGSALPHQLITGPSCLMYIERPMGRLRYIPVTRQSIARRGLHEGASCLRIEHGHAHSDVCAARRRAV